MTIAALVFAIALIAPAGYDPTATRAAICQRGYAKRHRHVPYRVRDAVYSAYGLPRGQRRGYRIDHQIPLELAGTNALANLRVQTRADAHQKDEDEDRLHEEVCSGSISLDAARSEMLRLWSAREPVHVR